MKLSHYFGSDGGWLRFWPKGPGIHWTRRAPLFSERYGYCKPFMVVRNWRFFTLRRWPE